MDSASYEDTVKAVLTRATEFDVRLSRAKKLNSELQAKCEKVLQSIVELVGAVNVHKKKTCSVCYTRELTTTLIPCGHVFCDSCCERAKRTNRCFTCRQRIDDSMRVYP